MKCIGKPCQKENEIKNVKGGCPKCGNQVVNSPAINTNFETDKPVLGVLGGGMSYYNVKNTLGDDYVFVIDPEHE